MVFEPHVVLGRYGSVRRHKSLADIERGFCILKSEIETGPIYHRLPDRIRAHAKTCFIALILYRVIRTRLHTCAATMKPERYWPKLRRTHHHTVAVNGAQHVARLSIISKEHTEILAALAIKKPTLKRN